jgi:hypothetical protein
LAGGEYGPEPEDEQREAVHEAEENEGAEEVQMAGPEALREAAREEALQDEGIDGGPAALAAQEEGSEGASRAAAAAADA